MSEHNFNGLRADTGRASSYITFAGLLRRTLLYHSELLR